MRILVAGGAGFIGSHLCDALLAAGHEVTAVDNLCTGSRRNLEHLAQQPRFGFVEADVANPQALDHNGRLGPPVISLSQVLAQHWDVVYHLASPASPPGYWARPVGTMMANSLGSHFLLELARRDGARFLLASTSEVYGDPLVHPQEETYFGNVNPVGPRSCYDEGKRYAEALTINYYRQGYVDARIVRIFNTYGPRSRPDDGRFIPTFITAALQGADLPVHGDGHQTRSLCYVSDLVRGLILCLFEEGSAGEVFNLGNPDERSVLEVAQLVVRLANSSSAIVHVEGRQEDIARRRPNTDKVKQAFGWQPQVSLEAGLRQTIPWFSREIGLPDPLAGSTSSPRAAGESLAR